MSTSGFLSFNRRPPRLHITAESDDFDQVTLQHWREEGFDVTYTPMGDNPKAYASWVKHIHEALELGESYAIIAYGDAATVCLDVAQKPMPHCAALVCYYPTSIPNPSYKYPTQLNLLVHLAASQGFAPRFKSYVYPAVEPGFAEQDLPEYDKVAGRLSWTRSLGAVRKGFKTEVDLEPVWDEHVELEFATKNAAATMSTMVQQPYVNHIPTLTGGIGKRDLYIFYRDFFIPNNPPSLNMRLVSRTIGVDRIVDEMIISFRHTQEIPWMLPGVPPTNKKVEVALVSVVAMRGKKLCHEHIYWDQASVLVQIGLLDPKLVPNDMKAKGLKQLPVVGAEAARKVADEDSVPSNDLLPKWKETVEANKNQLPTRDRSRASSSGRMLNGDNQA